MYSWTARNGDGKMKKLELIVAHYIKHQRPETAKQRRFWKRKPWEEALRAAAFCEIQNCNGRVVRHPHQYRIPRVALAKVYAKLVKLDLRSTKDFEELHCCVDRAIRPIKGIGDLAIYDIAHRIGLNRRREPKRVHLHAGAREGARALGIRSKSAAVSGFPHAFHRLDAAEIEDCLCIYKDELANNRASKTLRVESCQPVLRKTC